MERRKQLFRLVTLYFIRHDCPIASAALLFLNASSCHGISFFIRIVFSDWRVIDKSGYSKIKSALSLIFSLESHAFRESLSDGGQVF